MEQQDGIQNTFTILRRSPEWANDRDAMMMMGNKLVRNAFANGASVGYSPMSTFADILQCLEC
jgi:hypothetical protein